MIYYASYSSLSNYAARIGHALVQICMHATAVQEVLIHASHPLFTGDALRSIQTVEDMSGVVAAQLAGSALQLHTLRCYLPELSSFPLMPALKH